jgi:hypothetical protein
MKRSGKFYRTNEKEVMKMLGFSPTLNSGSGWIEKEDGVNEYALCQLKSTDANSIKLNKQDLDTLQYNSNVVHKLPVFAVQFLKSNEVYLVVKPEDITDIAKFIKTGSVENIGVGFHLEDSKERKTYKTKRRKSPIKSSIGGRESYQKEQKARYKKNKSAL